MPEVNSILGVGNIWHPLQDHFWLAKLGMWGLVYSWVVYVARFIGVQCVTWLPHVRSPHARVVQVSRWALTLSTLLLTTSLVQRSLEAGFFALSNMYESLLVLVISLLASFLVVDIRDMLPQKYTSMMGWVVVTLALTTFWFALSLPTGIQPLQPSLVSYWRSIHVPIIILSYALFTLAMVASLLQLVHARHDPDNALPAEVLPSVVVTMANVDEPLVKEPASAMPLPQTEGFHALSQTYETFAYRCIGLGFPCLTIGIILGGLWANEAWGNYWSWDPKESMALVTLLGYGVYLHLRMAGQVSRRVLAYVSLASFVLMLVTYFGVNLMGLGLHSYGKFGS
ncbi:MAG: c-type cytochrome biogenesis protein CcsB [Vampirovibrionales bacterium]